MVQSNDSTIRKKEHRGTPQLSPDVSRRIVRHLATGGSRSGAAKAVNIDRSTLYLWVERGRREVDTPYAQFTEAVEQAEAACELSMVEEVTHAAPTNWTAAAWYLERRYPDEWGRRDRLDVTVKTRELVEQYARANGLSDDELAAALVEAEAIALGQRR